MAKAFLNVLSAIPTVATGITNAVSAIKNAIYNVKIVKADEEAVNKDLQKLGIEKFNKKCTSVHCKGIRPENVEKFLDRMADDYPGIDKDTRAKMNGYIFGEKLSFTVMEVKYTGSKNDAVYLMVVIEERDGKYDFSYVGCTIDFDIVGKKAPDIHKEILCNLFTKIEQGKGRDAQLISIAVIKELEDFIRYLVTREFEDAIKVVLAINAA